MSLILDGNDHSAAPPADLIKDSDTDNFSADVITPSDEVPVIVDFWSPSCEPCKQLTPLLETLVKQMRGAVKLVKINVDENHQLAAQFRVQSVPTIFAVHKGRPVDGFSGALPESQIKAFIQRLTKGAANPMDEAMEHAASLMENGDTDTAEQIYTQVLGQEPTHVPAVAGLLKCFMARGEPEQAKDLLARLPDDVLLKSEIVAVQTALDLLEQADGKTDIEPFEIRLAVNDADHEARFGLALALYGRGDSEGAINALLVILKQDMAWNNGAAKEQLLKIFEALGPSDPATLAGRRKLSSLIFA